MHLDLRYPIGLLLTIYGAILVIQGLLAGAKVLGLNVNLYWGAAMTACGFAALYFAKVRPKPDPTLAPPSGGPSMPEHDDVA